MIGAAALVPAPPHEVFAFLADLENHWKLADRFVEVLSLERSRPDLPGADGGRVRMHGPLLLRRTARTQVVAVDPPSGMAGTAEAGSGTRARVTWRLSGRDGGTWVELAAEVERAGALDRLLLAVGGAAYMRRRFSAILGRLSKRFALAPVPSDHVPDGGVTA